MRPICPDWNQKCDLNIICLGNETWNIWSFDFIAMGKFHFHFSLDSNSILRSTAATKTRSNVHAHRHTSVEANVVGWMRTSIDGFESELTFHYSIFKHQSTKRFTAMDKWVFLPVHHPDIQCSVFNLGPSARIRLEEKEKAASYFWTVIKYDRNKFHVGCRERRDTDWAGFRGVSIDLVTSNIRDDCGLLTHCNIVWVQLTHTQFRFNFFLSIVSHSLTLTLTRSFKFHFSHL